MNDIKKLIDEYSEEYCLFLEAAYGPNMMSEGGVVAIDRMFEEIPLRGKSMIDIGAGLGGVAFYIAEKHNANVVGLELGTWMVKEAARRTPVNLKSKVTFLAYEPPALSFADHSFDLIYSKGVLTHMQHKLPLFKEVFRVLKPDGIFLIEDWLSPIKEKWGARLQKMCEIENLTLYAETENNYKCILESCGFRDVEMSNLNNHYVQYNQDVVDRLRKKEIAKIFKASYGGITLQQTIECYQLIAESIRDNELLIRRIKCCK